MAFNFEDLATGPQKVDSKTLLPDIQGNILKGFGSLRMLFVFIRFPEDKAANQAWVRTNLLAPGAPFQLTSAVAQASSPPLLVNFFVTANGLVRLGGRADQLAAMDSAFQRGIRAEETRRILGDAPADEWAVKYRKAWDAMVLLAFDPSVTSAHPDLEASIRLSLAGLKGEVWIEYGNVLDSEGRPITAAPAAQPLVRYEPFGYRDNVSVTVFSEDHAKALGIPEEPKYNPRRPLSSVLRADPLSTRGFGSYFVYRKLKQDVPGFRTLVSRKADDLEVRGPYLNELYGSKGQGGAYAPFAPGRTPTRAEIELFVKGRIFGRLPSGDFPGAPGVANHDFDYSNDRGGAVCPFGGHARKMNAREQSGNRALEQQATIARRGIPYGSSSPDTTIKPEAGLLFLCAQADISKQFEFIQQRWANDFNPDFANQPTPMVDHVIGRSQPVLDDSGYEKTRYQRFTSTIEYDFAIWDLVTLEGGEYLFAPSISGLAALTSSSSVVPPSTGVMP